MQSVTPQLAAMLRTAIRAPRAYGMIQLPLVIYETLNTIDYSQLGSSLTIDHILSCQATRILEPGSDSVQVKLLNQDGSLSPITPVSPLGNYFSPGVVDNKLVLYFGLSGPNGETIAPQGVYLMDVVAQESVGGVNQITVTAQDGFYMFSGSVNTQFPPQLYGIQTSNYFNPNYALTNPSGDGMTWVSDCKQWMSDPTDAPYFASNFIIPSLYIGTVANPASTATTLAWTPDYEHGTVILDAPLGTSPDGTAWVVSVDALPLAMAPEDMMRHLFCDYGNLDPSFLKFDCSGMYLPVLAIGYEQTILDVAKSIIEATATRGTNWQLFFDELGYLNFRENVFDLPPVAVLTDERDILSWRPEYSARQIANVVRATCTSINNQPLTIVSYDTDSMNVFSTRTIYDIPSELLATIPGMDPGTAVSYLSSMTGSVLFEKCTPTVDAEAEVLYNPCYQPGDIVTIIEKKTGTQMDFSINQITTAIDGETVKQTLRLSQFKRSQDYMFGIGAYAGAGLPTSGSNASQGQTQLITDVSIGGTAVVTSGKPVTDQSLNQIQAVWSKGSPLPIVISTQAPVVNGTQCSLYVWRWIYIAEDAYVIAGNGELYKATGNGQSCGIYPSNPIGPNAAQIADLSGGYYAQTMSGGDHTSGHWPYTLPYDFRANLDTPNSRRFFWPLLRCSDWITTDGVTDVGGQTLTSTWSGGVGVEATQSVGNIITGAQTGVQLYGNLRVGLSDYFSNVTVGYTSQGLYYPNTPAANALGCSSFARYGVDFGPPVVANMIYGINRKQTPAYLCILAATDGGNIQFKRIPFILQF